MDKRREIPSLKNQDSQLGSNFGPNLEFSWIYQFQGMLLLFLMVVSLTWIFSAEVRAGEFPIGPTWLNFGFSYADFYPSMITLVDLGIQMFMFILGISLTISFKKYSQEKNHLYAWISVGTQFFVLLWLAELTQLDLDAFYWNDIVVLSIWLIFTISCAIFRNLKRFKSSKTGLLLGFIWSVGSVLLWFLKFDATIWILFFNHELALLAWGCLFAIVSLNLIKNPDRRIILPVILLCVHFLLWEVIGQWDTTLFSGTLLEFYIEIPYEIIGISIAAITATCVWEWIQLQTTSFKVGFKIRIIPLMVVTFIVHIMVDFFQPADQRVLNTSLTLLAIAFSSLVTMCFYVLEHYYKFNVRILNSLGKNALAIFLLQIVLTFPFRFIWESEGGNAFRIAVMNWLSLPDKTHIAVNLVCLTVFLLPIIFIILSARIMEKLHIHITI
ncbi:MAG: hypothetical protein JW776_13455 [Candidatus Lokiarchaeota archaeon]|nr:hypothetical protein [Candidatus Lokiarchaeota archaeon]